MTDDLRTLIDERDRRYEERFRAQEAAVQAALSAAQTAVSKAEASMEKRIDQTNEWRAAMSDRDKNYLTVDAYQGERRALQIELAALSTRVNLFAGAVALIVIAVPIVTALLVRSS